MACSVVDSPSQRSVWSAVAMARRLEPSMLTMTWAVLVHPPCGLVMVTVKVCDSWRATVWVVCALGLTTMLAGSQWKLKVPCVPGSAVRVVLAP